jgi:hypothetical protein
MQAKRSALAQRAIVSIILSSDHTEVWTRSELEQALDSAVSDQLAKLTRAGIVIVDGERLRASRCVRHLDALGLIAV